MDRTFRNAMGGFQFCHQFFRCKIPHRPRMLRSRHRAQPGSLAPFAEELFFILSPCPDSSGLGQRCPGASRKLYCHVRRRKGGRWRRSPIQLTRFLPLPTTYGVFANHIWFNAVFVAARFRPGTALRPKARATTTLIRCRIFEFNVFHHSRPNAALPRIPWSHSDENLSS